LRAEPPSILEKRVKSSRAARAAACAKAPTGIAGFDEITHGGLPQGRTTLLAGGPGSGKTIFAMQFLKHGIQSCGEPGIFVAFEETPERIVANLNGFGWQIDKLVPKKLYFMDAQPTLEVMRSGDFDLSGMLAALGAVADKMRAGRVVFDALDVLLADLPDEAARKREIYRIHQWLLSRQLTGLITAKAADEDSRAAGLQSLGFMQFMVDCAVMLNHRVALGVSQRNLRVQKFRGTNFDENECPFVISKKGFDVAISRGLGRHDIQVSNERVTSGVERLDTMLGGGYYRASSVLITGSPGTAKTTLCGAFTEAACRRGEKTLFVSFDSDGSEVARNLVSVGIQLNQYVKRGLLRMISARTIIGSSETLLVKIKALAQEHGARCLVIDPVSTLSRAGNELTAHGVAERLIDWCKTDAITLMCSSLLDDSTSQLNGGTPLQISTLADTWIHLNYLVQSGERNRALSIIKSRGTAHSNQVRELILSDDGITLSDIYTSGGEVLMGTLRWEKETALLKDGELAATEGAIKRLLLDAEEAELRVRIQSLRTELQAKRAEKKLLSHTVQNRRGEVARGLERMQKLRGADAIIEET
jgi:circadian clock protein KaiC